MKIFISYRFTGEDPDVLRKIIKNICDSLEKAGHVAFCSFWKSSLFREREFTNKQVLEYALKELDNADIYLAFIKSDDKSEGMLLEAGYALAKKKKICLAIKKGIKTTFFREIAGTVIEFDDLDKLYVELSRLKF